jgi:hypothetical protein
VTRSAERLDREGGYTVVETAVAILLTAILLGLLLGSVVSGGRTLRRVAALADRIEAARVARVLAERLAAADGIVGPAQRSDEVRVHLPIGWAEPCDSSFLWYGIRTPDPERDSALVVDSRSRVHRVAVAGSDAHPCEVRPPTPVPGGSMRTIELSPPVPGAMIVRVFESGVVRVDDAVRYARVGTSRQPLTAAVLDPSRSGAGVQDGALKLVIADSTRRWEGTWTGR